MLKWMISAYPCTRVFIEHLLHNIKVDPGGFSLDDVVSLNTAFIKAAERSFQAGFDGVQLYDAQGYLLSQFCLPDTINVEILMVEVWETGPV